MAGWTGRVGLAVGMCIVAVGPGTGAGQEVLKSRPRAVFRDIEFRGNQTFSRSQLLGELYRQTDLCDSDGMTAADGAGSRLLENSLLVGYHRSGFPEAKVRVTFSGGRLVAAIEEGPVYRMASVHVTGPDQSSSAVIEEALNAVISGDPSVSEMEGLTPLSRSYVLRKLRPGELAIQKPNSSAALEKQIRELLETDGFLFPELTASFETDAKSKTVRPWIQLRKAGSRLKISEVQVKGLKQNRREDVEALLEVGPGTEYSRQLVERIRTTLYRTGRFLHVHVWHEFPFGPDQDVSLHVDLREFDLIPPLHEELTESQRLARNFAEWLNLWRSSPEDLVIEADFLAASFEESEKTVAGFYRTGTQLQGSAALFLPHLSADSRVKLRAVVSPDRGTAFSISVHGKDGIERDQRRIVIAQDSMMVLFPESGRYWESDTPRQGCTIFCNIAGQPEPSEKRAILMAGVKTNNLENSGLKLSLAANEAALIHMVLNESEGATSLTADGDRRELNSGTIRLTAEGGSVSDISSVEFRRGEALRVQVRSEVGAFAEEIDTIRQAADGLPDLCDETDELCSLLKMLLSELGPQWSKKEPLLSHLAAALVAHPESLSGILGSFGDLTERADFQIPHEGEYLDRQNPGTGSMAFFLSRLGTKDSGAGLLSEALRQSQFVDSRGAWNEYLGNLVSDPQRGAIDCLLPALYFENNREQIASVALHRLSTESFVADVNRYLTQPCIVRELLVLAVRHIRGTDDAEFELLVRDLDRAFFGQAASGQATAGPASIRPLLVLIRRHQGEEPLVILKELLPIVWEGGLKQQVRQRLEQLKEQERSSFRHQIREVSSGKEQGQETGRK